MKIKGLSEQLGDRDAAARICQLEAIIENLYPFFDRVEFLTQTEKEQRRKMVEHLESLMPWLLPRRRLHRES
jgi:hypothetical protein